MRSIASANTEPQASPSDRQQHAFSLAAVDPKTSGDLSK
jgi:hypothetical protein